MVSSYIELSVGDLINLDNVFAITKHESNNSEQPFAIKFISCDAGTYCTEKFANELERDREYNRICSAANAVRLRNIDG